MQSANKFSYKIIFAIISVFFITSNIDGQPKPDSISPSLFKSVHKSGLLLFSAGYRLPLNENNIINSGHGLFFDIGVNATHFVSEKLLIGIYGGRAFKDGLWYTSFNKKFIDDFNVSFISEKQFSGLDSAVISSAKKLISATKGSSVILPGCEMKSFHSYSFYYGIILRLPFQKYDPVLKMYTGVTNTVYQGNSIATQGQEFNYYEIRQKMYGTELIFFRGKQIRCFNNEFKKSINWNIGSLSIYYEQCNFSHSSLYFSDGNRTATIPFSSFVSSSFLKKYNKSENWGIKLSVNIL